jgi:hypothetical protein
MSGSKQIITAELNYLEQRQKINDFFSAPASSNCNFEKKEKIDLERNRNITRRLAIHPKPIIRYRPT